MMKSEILFERAKKVMPGGVNSPVRAYQSVGMSPPFIVQAKDQTVVDEDGNQYLDYVGSWGPMILGQANADVCRAVTEAAQNGLSFGAPTEREVLLAELITQMVPNVSMMRMVNSGTEAVMSALRLARGFTGRDKVVKFAGCYHGHSDAMLVKAGSGLMTAGIPDSLGVPKKAAADTLTAEYNNLTSVKVLFEQYPKEIAAIIVEPLAANMGVVLPEKGFLAGLRSLCNEYGALLIFDEVITGFRLKRGGAQEYFGVNADLVTYGKIVGGGMPVGAYGGSKEIMRNVAPIGNVYQAGTLSGNPIAMAAGLAQLRILQRDHTVYEHISEIGKRLAEGFRQLIFVHHIPAVVNQAESLLSVFFSADP
ncbi:MAG: glutamate-1-semialdehyde 2,1-aminomutase, partial [Oscillospiraceae bacterium]